MRQSSSYKFLSPVLPSKDDWWLLTASVHWKNSRHRHFLSAASAATSPPLIKTHLYILAESVADRPTAECSHDYHLAMPATATVLVPSLSTANYWCKDNELLRCSILCFVSLPEVHFTTAFDFAWVGPSTSAPSKHQHNRNNEDNYLNNSASV